MTTAGPRTDWEIPDYLRSLDIPGLADIHVHFLPEPMLRKVWAYFDAATDNYGAAWPITYRFDEATRLAVLRGFGVRAIPALTYPHKPGMARWLNEWNADFARRVPDSVHCGTLYPEPDVAEYVADALSSGARLFKMHVQVGRYAPDDAQLDGAWEQLSAAGAPVVIHAGSAPLPGEFTGSERIARVLTKHPRLTLVIAHAGMPEYHEFADLVERYDNVQLDTTMVATDFTDRFAPLPDGYVARLAELGERVVLGSDFPNIPYPYAHQLAALARLDLGDDWMRKVLWDNGTRLLSGPAAGR
ncbi:MAG TPA: amidohydrolase family protein [Flexivirga sp.]|uniref:amidohydrolase family protein n=1 Tax=Flexivirga sp. TaxID=1962927 RepID=UPI002C6746C7|nr:amidohydrolase family protein [Flexivirga sp.]HWC23482.1 amidohydrolase family protein [Flexivirga sp.]